MLCSFENASYLQRALGFTPLITRLSSVVSSASQGKRGWDVQTRPLSNYRNTPGYHRNINWDDDSFHHYTSGRWLFNEAKQLAARHVDFNMNELVKVATENLGCDLSSCAGVRKLPEGNYNKAFELAMFDGRQVIAKVPNPNAGLPINTTASEVATLDFVS